MAKKNLCKLSKETEKLEILEALNLESMWSTASIPAMEYCNEEQNNKIQKYVKHLQIY